MTRHKPSRTEPYVGVRAQPDTVAIGKILGLQAFIGSGLNGTQAQVAGGVRGVDRGDPSVSLTGPVKATVSPTNAIAAVTAGTGAGYRPPQTIQDTALTDPNLDPYNGLLLARMQRPA
jgi:hypothetical protein